MHMGERRKSYASHGGIFSIMRERYAEGKERGRKEKEEEIFMHEEKGKRE